MPATVAGGAARPWQGLQAAQSLDYEPDASVFVMGARLRTQTLDKARALAGAPKAAGWVTSRPADP
jgi:hypothetical protein